jgi:hypothetical protein
MACAVAMTVDAEDRLRVDQDGNRPRREVREEGSHPIPFRNRNTHGGNGLGPASHLAAMDATQEGNRLRLRPLVKVIDSVLLHAAKRGSRVLRQRKKDFQKNAGSSKKKIASPGSQARGGGIV